MGNIVDGYVKIEREGDPSKSLNKVVNKVVSNTGTKVIIKKKKDKKDSFAKRVSKYLAARVVDKPIVKKSNVSYDVSATEFETEEGDRSRFFNKTFEQEKRKLFFR